MIPITIKYCQTICVFIEHRILRVRNSNVPKKVFPLAQRLLLRSTNYPLCVKQFYWLQFEFRKTPLAKLILYQTECHWQLLFKSLEPNSRKRTYVCCYRMNHALNNKNVSCFIQKHSVAKLLPTRQLTNVLPRLKRLNAITAFTPLTVTTNEIYLYRARSGFDLTGLETEMPVTTYWSPEKPSCTCFQGFAC